MERKAWSAIAPTTGDIGNIDQYAEASSLYAEWIKSGCQEPIPPTYLSVVWDDDRKLVRRNRGLVSFAGAVKAWQMFKLLMRRNTGYASRNDLFDAAWDDDEKCLHDPEKVVYPILSQLKNLLEPLGLVVRSYRGDGYRLEKKSQDS